MPVGTLGTVKAVHISELKEDIGAEIILEIPIISICVGLKVFRVQADCIASTDGTFRC